MAYNNNPRIVTDGMDVCLDANSVASFPDNLDINTGWSDYNNQSANYTVLGKDSVYLKNTTTGFVGRFVSQVVSTGYHFVMFDYVADASSTLVVDNDGVSDNVFNTSLTATTTKQTYFGVANITSTGTSQMYLRRNSGGNITISNYRFGEVHWISRAGLINFNRVINFPIFNNIGIKHFSFSSSSPHNILGTISGSRTLTNYTRMAWFNYSTSDGNFNPIIGNQVGNNIDMALTILSNKLHFRQYTNTYTNGTTSGDYGVSSSTTLSSGTWYHGAIVVSRGDNNVKFYLNGSLDNSATINTLGISTSDYVMVGGPYTDSYSGARYFDGKIAQVLSYNRSLSPAEILQNYEAHKSRFGL